MNKLDMQFKYEVKYGMQILRPEMAGRIIGPSKAELRIILLHRIKDAIIQIVLLAAMFTCFSFSFAMMMKTVHGF